MRTKKLAHFVSCHSWLKIFLIFKENLTPLWILHANFSLESEIGCLNRGRLSHLILAYGQNLYFWKNP